MTNPAAETPHPEITLVARTGTQVTPVAATLVEVIPAVRVVGRISRRTISAITFNHNTVESLTSDPIPLPQR